MSLSNKIDFAVVFKVKNANPNGDPLSGNRPRINYDSLGEVTDVCLKRKIRNHLMERGVDIFVQSDDNKKDDYKNLSERYKKEIPQSVSKKEKTEKACAKWFDVRAFGQVFAYDGKNDEADAVSIGIRGPVSIQSAFSCQPVDITSIQITKSASSTGDGNKKSSDTMGMKHRVDRGVYVFFGSMNPQLAAKTGFSDQDAQVIKEILPKLFENDASSARPEGSMAVEKVIWWQHKCPSGQASSARIHKSLELDTTDFDNIKISLDNSIEPMPEMISGY
ncbi:CRISPR-associated protein [Dehalococcoides mccartyi]|uniref:CRISPR-associated protein n=1 Tax=Dehalococcoides mccartyi TaxID=61435 RepID=A0A0V8M5E0_9CHLR|nr:type I-C CRISPR-associated protein Cas7/Csd2 [Dehalococcoides mccartyi]KSV18989.1 CRISPR-associated protein [Dehalococcoides mccartyi]